MKHLIFIFLILLLSGFSEHKFSGEEYTCLIFENGFDNTEVKITVGDSIVFQGKLTTNHGSGVAKTECISRELLHAKSIEVVVEGSKPKIIEPKAHKFIYINYSKLLISVKHSHQNKHLEY